MSDRHPTAPHLIFERSGAVKVDWSHPDAKAALLRACERIKRIRLKERKT